MPKDILLYGSIWDYQAMFFSQQIAEALEEDPEAELTLRINSEGGNPEYGMSIILKAQEMRDQMKAIVEGQAHSMAFSLLAYLDDVSAIDTAQFILHRASYGQWTEGRPEFEGSLAAQSLTKTNKDLEKALRAKMDVEKFEALPQMKEKGWTLKDIFALDDRKEVLLSAQDMKKVGLVKTIIKVTPQKAAQIEKIFKAATSTNSLDGLRKAAQIQEPKEEPKKVAMTLAELKAQHPAIYAEAKAEGVTEGTTQERDRAGAWLAWQKIDPEMVLKGIKEGKAMTQTETSELQAKAVSVAMLGNLGKGNANDLNPGEAPAEQTEQEKKEAAFLGSVDKVFGKKK